MTFILGAVLFLLGGFFGMLIMSFAQAIPKRVDEQHQELTRQLRLVVEDE
jgi:hypothetical protein